jgi:hypothetical protein
MLAVCAAGILLAYGLFRFPTVLTASPTGAHSLIGVLAILTLYAAVGWFGPAFTERIHPRILHAGILAAC